MSAWGISNFENDTALDWIEKFIEKKDGGSLKSEVKDFVQNFDVEETSLMDCAQFLTVAEVLAGLLGSPSEDFPEELADWVEKKYTKIEQDLITKTIDGVKLILKDSEAKEMYAGSGYEASWVKTQKELIKRLSE